MKKYFGYIRVSTVRQGEHGSSLQEQKSAIEGYAKRHGLCIIEWFEEQETAAAQGRPVFGRMLKAIEQRKADGVITHKIDRSARNLKDWSHIGDLIDHGVEMHFAHESLDLASRSGRLSADILAVVASDYIRNLRDEVRKGYYGRLKQGLYPSAAPLGYLDQGGGKPKIIDPVRGPLVRRAFELYQTGLWSLRTLGDELYARGLRNRGGGRVTHTGLSNILNNPFYVGIIKLKRSGEVFAGAHQPLIDAETFRGVADVLAGRTQRRGAVRRRFRYQRLIRCAGCGYMLTAERQRGLVYYRCHTRGCQGECIRETAINDTFATKLAQLDLSDTEWRAVERDIVRMLEGTANERPKERQRLTLQHAAVEDRLKRTTDAYIDTMIDKETFAARKEALLFEQATIRSQLAQIDMGNRSVESHAQKMFELTKRLSRLAISPTDDKYRQVLVDTTSNMRVQSKKLVIDWQNPFDRLISDRSVLTGCPERSDLRRVGIAEIIMRAAMEHADEETGADS